MSAGLAARPHNEECRQRMDASLKVDEPEMEERAYRGQREDKFGEASKDIFHRQRPYTRLQVLLIVR